MKEEGAKMKQLQIMKRDEYPTLYFDAPDMLLKEPAYQKAYIEAFWKPDRSSAAGYCENTTVYD